MTFTYYADIAGQRVTIVTPVPMTKFEDLDIATHELAGALEQINRLFAVQNIHLANITLELKT